MRNVTAYAFYQFVKSRRRKSKKRIKRIRARYPFKHEAQLYKLLSRMFASAGKQFLNWFTNRIPKWRVEQRYDSWESDIDFFMEEFNEHLNDYMTNKLFIDIDIKTYINKLAEFFFAFAGGELARQLEEMLGERFYGGDLWWETVKTQWIENLKARALGTAREFFATRLHDAIFKAAREGKGFDEILKIVKSQIKGLSEKQALNLAKDMAGTLDGTITKLFHESIGIELYTWQTAADERVRGRPGGLYPKAIPSHWSMEGVICKWIDSTVYSNDGFSWMERRSEMPREIPGIPYGCRCVAFPWLDIVIKEVDNELLKEEGGKK